MEQTTDGLKSNRGQNSNLTNLQRAGVTLEGSIGFSRKTVLDFFYGKSILTE